MGMHSLQIQKYTIVKKKIEHVFYYVYLQWFPDLNNGVWFQFKKCSLYKLRYKWLENFMTYFPVGGLFSLFIYRNWFEGIREINKMTRYKFSYHQNSPESTLFETFISHLINFIFFYIYLFVCR